MSRRDTGDASDRDAGGASQRGAQGALQDYSEEGLAGLLIVVGVVLFFFPEPATSTLGIILILIGAIIWLIDWLW